MISPTAVLIERHIFLLFWQYLLQLIIAQSQGASASKFRHWHYKKYEKKCRTIFVECSQVCWETYSVWGAGHPSTSFIYLYPYSTQVSACSQGVYDFPCGEIQVLWILPITSFIYFSLWSFMYSFICLFVHSFLSWLCKLQDHISWTKLILKVVAFRIFLISC